MDTKTITISELVDELERIQQELFSLQKKLEKLEKAETDSADKDRSTKIAEG